MRAFQVMVTSAGGSALAVRVRSGGDALPFSISEFGFSVFFCQV